MSANVLNLPDRLLRYERNVVWLEPIGRHDYVIERVVFTDEPTGPIRFRVDHLVGFSECRPVNPPPPDGYARRIFYVTLIDRLRRPDGLYRADCPLGAVDARTVSAGRFGQVTERSAGVPLRRDWFGVWRYPNRMIQW